MKINKDCVAIGVILIIFILYLNVSLNSPIVFGDEGYYAYTAEWTVENNIIPEYLPVWDTDIYHNKLYKLPMFLMFETFFFMIAGEAGMKFMMPLFAMLGALLIYVFMKKIGKPNVGIIASFIFLAAPAIVTYGVLNYVDVLAAMFFILAFMFMYKAFESEHFDKRACLLTGIFGGLAVLTKASGPGIFIILLLYPLITGKKYKINMKTIGTILVVGLLVTSPWLIRNVALFGTFCYKIDEFMCKPVMDIELEHIEGLEWAGRTSGSGTEANLLQFGMIPFSVFAFGWIFIILFLLGLPFIKKHKYGPMIIAWLLLAIPLLYWGQNRAEDAARFMVPIIPAMAIVSGIFVDKAYGFMKQKSKIIAILVILLVLAGAWTFGQQKLNTMASVKSFPDGFFDACDWVEHNTPKDSTLFGVYSQQAAFNCKRPVSTGDHQKEIVLTADDRSYKYLKAYGYDYVWIPVFTVSNQAYSESLTVSFVNYIQTSPKFEIAYDNTGLYGNAGVLVYKVL